MIPVRSKRLARKRTVQTRERPLYENKTKLGDSAYKFPPTPRVGLVWPGPHHPALILLFAKKFFRSPRRTNEVNRTNILAPGIAFFPPSPSQPEHRHLACVANPERIRGRFRAERLAQWEVVSSYSSATAPDSHGISCADPLFQARKELEPRTSDLRSASQDLSNQPTNPTLWPRLILLLT